MAIGEIDGDDGWAAGSMLIDTWKGRMPSPANTLSFDRKQLYY